MIKITFILVEPAVPENVGAAARAIKTMGFNSLRLVNPCEFREGKARWLAHASGDILDQALVFDDLELAIHDLDFVVGTSAKPRSVKGDYHAAEELSQILVGKKDSIQTTAIVFGREESGLTNDEMKLCDILTYIPMKTTYPSLNLAQAVMLYAYLLSENNITKGENEGFQPGQSKYLAMKNSVTNLLRDTKIHSNPNIYQRIFERLAILGDDDVNLILSVCETLSNKKD